MPDLQTSIWFMAIPYTHFVDFLPLYLSGLGLYLYVRWARRDHWKGRRQQ